MKEQTINEIIRVEGGYVNDPKDSGGESSPSIGLYDTGLPALPPH